MVTLLLIVWTTVVVLLILIDAVQPERSPHSWFELKRRGDERAMRRERLLADVVGIRRFAVGVLLVTLALLGYSLWQAWGVVFTFIVWTVSGSLTRWSLIRRLSQRIYRWIEPQLLDMLTKAKAIGWVVRTDNWRPHDQRLESSDQLLHLVESSGHVLSPDQQDIIRSGLRWHTVTVETVMTPAKKIVSVKNRELLGPLVLDDLHRSNHTRFPVIRGSIDNVVGILDISDLLEVNAAKSSETAERIMRPEVLRIESDEPLPQALALLQKSHQHMLIVNDRDGKTAGLITLTDITGALLGKNRGKMV